MIKPFQYHIHIWQVSPQLSWGDTCQIWIWIYIQIWKYIQTSKWFWINSPYFAVFPHFLNDQHADYLLNIMLIFDRSHHNWAATTPVKYEFDIKYPKGTIYQIINNPNGDLISVTSAVTLMSSLPGADAPCSQGWHALKQKDKMQSSFKTVFSKYP